VHAQKQSRLSNMDEILYVGGHILDLITNANFWWRSVKGFEAAGGG